MEYTGNPFELVLIVLFKTRIKLDIMKNKYSKKVSLKCITCGDTSFDFNEGKTWVKCQKCGREYDGGYDELVILNQGEIDKEVEKLGIDLVEDLKSDISGSLKNILKGNKNIKFK